MRKDPSNDRGFGELHSELVVSAGGVIYRETDGKLEVALIFHRGDWCLPKGLVEQNETLAGAALREVKEETGLEGELVSKIDDISYDFFIRKHYSKIVHFYLFRFVGGSVDAHDSEADMSNGSPFLMLLGS